MKDVDGWNKNKSKRKDKGEVEELEVYNIPGSKS